MGLNWYKAREDSLNTIDLGPAANLLLGVTWSYAGVTSVTPQAVIAEGGTVAATVESFSDTGMTIRVQGSGGRIPFRIAFAGGQIEDLTLRFKLVET